LKGKLDDKIGTEVETLSENDSWAQGQFFMMVEQLRAENESLKEMLRRDAQGIEEMMLENNFLKLYASPETVSKIQYAREALHRRRATNET